MGFGIAAVYWDYIYLAVPGSSGTLQENTAGTDRAGICIKPNRHLHLLPASFAISGMSWAWPDSRTKE